MYKGKKIAVVVPARDEEKQLPGVLDSLPELVDFAVVVDDASADGTARVAAEHAARRPERVSVVTLSENRGVGGAIAAGYARALELGAEIAAVMAGDGQMDPTRLPELLDPVAAGEADYAKGNRFIRGGAWRRIPRLRLLGNAVLSVLTKIASGYWHVSDSQNGYTAASAETVRELLEDGVYPGYGMPNDVLVTLNIHRRRVREVPMEPVYGVGERSKMAIPRVVWPIAWLLARRFFRRLWRKYVVRDTHPLVLFYLLGLLLTPLGVAYGALILMTRVVGPTLLATAAFQPFHPVCTASGIVLDAVLTLSGLQLLLFAMWFDMQDNGGLK